MGAHRRVTRRSTTLRTARRFAGGGAVGVAALTSVLGGTGVADASTTVDAGGVSVTVPTGCDIYLSSGFATMVPDSDETRACLAGADSPSDSSGTSSTSTGSTSSSTSTTSSGSGSTSTSTPSSTSTTTPTAPSTTTSTSTRPAVLTSSGTPSTDPADQPAAPGETKSVPIG